MTLDPSKNKVRLRSPAATIGVFAAGIAHEIRSPVGAIVSSAQLLGQLDRQVQDEPASPNGAAANSKSAAAVDALASISAAAERLEDFVKSLEGLQTEHLDDDQVGSLSDALRAALAAADSGGARVVLEGDAPECYCQFPIVRHMMQMLVERLVLGLAPSSRLFLNGRASGGHAVVELRSDDPDWTKANLDALLDIGLTGVRTTARLEVGVLAAVLLLQHIQGEIGAVEQYQPRLRIRFPVKRRPEPGEVVAAAVAE